MALADVVTLSCLRPPAGETLLARTFKALVDDPRGELFAWTADQLLDAMCDRLEVPIEARGAAVAEARRYAGLALDRAEREGLTPIPCTDERYPSWLWEVADPPPVLWVKGVAGAVAVPAVAVVGSRHASPAGLALARQLGHGLAEVGLLVVSGLARGVDGASHEGALEAGGRTLGVLGCGADVIYPAEHRDLTARVAASAGVWSELPPGTTPQPHYFPLRNRIISGLSRAVVVIEAGERSGSLITARMALEQGREVLAVPGSVLSGRSRGCHALIKDGARLVETVGDVLDELGWARPDESTERMDSKSLPISDLESKMVPGDVHDVDGLAKLTGWATGQLLAELASLEIHGRVARVPGGWVRR